MRNELRIIPQVGNALAPALQYASIQNTISYSNWKKNLRLRIKDFRWVLGEVNQKIVDIVGWKYNTD